MNLFILLSTLFCCTMAALCLSLSHFGPIFVDDLGSRLDKIESEMIHFDLALGQLLHSRQIQLWNSETRTFHEGQQSTELLRDKWQLFMATFSDWALDRYTASLKNCSQNNLSPASHQERKFQELCHYLELVIKRFTQVPVRFQQSAKHDQLLSLLSHQFQSLEIEFDGRLYRGDESVNRLMSRLNSAHDLRQVWTQWRQQVSEQIEPLFQELMLGLDPDSGTEIWRHLHGDLGDADQLLPDAVRLWTQVEPFYNLLVDYIRSQLNLTDPSGSIPVYLLRSLTGTQFDSIYEQVRPYPKPDPDQSPNESELVKANKIYLQFGFESLPDQFWTNSQFLSESSQQSASCQPLTFDMFARLYQFKASPMEDVRIRMCLPSPTQSDLGSGQHLRKLLHELGHVYYFDSYRSSPNLYKIFSVNSALHEAIGETIILANSGCQLSSQSPEQNPDQQWQSVINGLLREALTSFVRIPYALTLEQWRHDWLTKSAKSMRHLNQHYWQLRQQIQHIGPGADSGQPNTNLSTVLDEHPYLDPLSKYHVIHFMPYLRYLFATFMQHQLYDSLCPKESHQSLCCPSAQSWHRFRHFLTESVPAPTTQSNFGTGPAKQYRAEPLLRYYQPLIDWLTQWKREQRPN